MHHAPLRLLAPIVMVIGSALLLGGCFRFGFDDEVTDAAPWDARGRDQPPISDGSGSEAPRADGPPDEDSRSEEGGFIDGRKKRALGATCAAPGECSSGFCVDERCCTTRCDDRCQACNVPDHLGICAPIPAGKDPDKECVGKTALCSGSCDGAGACRWSTDACDGACVAASGKAGLFTLRRRFCVSGVCSKAFKVVSCGFTSCRGSGASSSCRQDDACVGQSDCVSTSVCDRINAHVTGRGRCVDPKNVAIGIAGAALKAEADRALTAKRTHLKLQGGTYGPLFLSSPAGLTVIATGKVSLNPTKVGEPVVSVTGAGVTLSVQGVTISGPSMGTGGPALRCADGVVRVVESTITKSSGIGIQGSACEVVLRRSRLVGNKGGALSLNGGSLVAVNNLFVVNGGLNAPLGGASLVGVAGAFVNNTVADNRALISAPGGVYCQSSLVIIANSLITNNSGRAVSGCRLAKSLLVPLSVPGGISVAYKPSDLRAINTGDNKVVDSKLDFLSAPRILSGVVDLGAFEVK